MDFRTDSQGTEHSNKEDTARGDRVKPGKQQASSDTCTSGKCTEVCCLNLYHVDAGYHLTISALETYGIADIGEQKTKPHIMGETVRLVSEDPFN